jgi:hypothetical protein
MSTYYGQTDSNSVKVDDKTSVQRLLETYEDNTSLRPRWYGSTLRLRDDEGAAYIEEEIIDEFLSSLGAHIENPLLIRSVGFSRRAGLPNATQWVVSPDGEWRVERLQDPEATAEKGSDQ